MISFKNSIAFRTFVISFILLSVPLLVDSFIILQSRYLESVRTAKQILLEESSERDFRLSRFLQKRTPVMLYIVEALKLQENFPKEKSNELESKLQEVAKGGGFSEVALLKSLPEARFSVVGASFQDSTKKLLNSYKLYEKIASENYFKGTFSQLYKSPEGEYYLIFGITVNDPKNINTLGMLIISNDVTANVKELIQTDKYADYQFSFGILNDKMIVVASTDPSLYGQHFLPIVSEGGEVPGPNEEVSKEPMTISYEQGHPFFNFQWQDQNQVGVVSLIPQTDFYLLSYGNQNQIEMFPMLDFLEFYAIYALLLVCGGTIAYFLVKRISKPFFHLSTVMEGIQKGNLHVRYKEDKVGFEINTLGNTFNKMIDTLLEKKHLAEEEHVKSEIYEKELRIGQQVQRGLLPEKMPYLKSVSIAARYLPAKEVGGDFYDVFERKIGNKEELVFAIADASGKGVHACFYSLGVRSGLRTFAREYEDLDAVMKSTNALFCQDTADTGMFVTLLVGILDPVAKNFSYCSLGHNPPILRHRDKKVEFLQGRSFAAGIDESLEPKKETLQLAEGDVIVFYTDGITEAQNDNQELFGDERLTTFIQENGDLDVNTLAERLIEEVKKFEAGAPQHDDITLLIIKLEKP